MTPTAFKMAGRIAMAVAVSAALQISGANAQTAAEFNPTNFNAADWARFVKESGARYLVITAKHHEGFAMFDSKASPFNIVDATPIIRIR